MKEPSLNKIATPLTTRLNYYRFNIENKDEKAEYNELCKRLKAMGLKKFDTIAMQGTSQFYKGLSKLDGKRITLECEHLFQNQWNSGPLKGLCENGARLFDWAEPIYPNRNIKEGYWLEQTKEMVDVRQNTYKCRYCYRQYDSPGTCTECSKGGFPPEGDQIKLTELVRVVDFW